VPELLAASLAFLFAVCLLFIGEILRVVTFKPLQVLREHIVTIIDRLEFYANTITRHFDDKPSETEIELILSYTSHLRSAAAQLKAKYSIIKGKKWLMKFGLIPSDNAINESVKSLYYLSNSVLFKGHVDRKHNNGVINSEEADKIKELLTNY